MSDTKAVERIEAFKKEFLAEERIVQELHNYGAWLLNNPNAEPLERRAEKNNRAKTLVQEILHQELQKARKSERELVIAEINKKYWLNPKRSKSDVAKDNAWNDLGNTLRNGV